jgi:hypothetical protein
MPAGQKEVISTVDEKADAVTPPQRDGPQSLDEWEIEELANAAQIYVDAFTDDDLLTYFEAMRLTSVKEVLEKMGRKQEWDDDT